MKRKKKRWPILAAAAAVPVILFAIVAKQYYDNRYVLSDRYYTVVPLGYDITPYANQQEDRVTDYTLTGYNAGGEARELEFSVLIDAHKSDLYPPGTWLCVSVSKQLVIGRRAVDESDVPEKAMEKIMADYTPIPASSPATYADERTRQLEAKNTPSLAVSCAADGTTLLYTYMYSADARELAEGDADLLDPVYAAQFRADQQAVPGLTAISLAIKLNDGTVIFSQKYDMRIEFDYEKG
ncbi:MAG: YxeA family protein [Oscillospiraceae bacterium]|nr:YxeA family protein [Oscillospiraceae bacterium]